MVGTIVFNVVFSSYGHPYPLLHDEKATTTANNAAKTAIFFETLVFMRFSIDLDITIKTAKLLF